MKNPAPKKLRPLRLPSPVTVRTDRRGRPVAVEPRAAHGGTPDGARAHGAGARSGTGTSATIGAGANERTGTGTRAQPDRGTNARTGAEAKPRTVIQIREAWRIDDEWWREPVSRLYYDVVLENGSRVILYRDLTDGRWYAQGGSG